MNFDPLSFAIGYHGDSGPVRDVVSYLIGRVAGTASEIWQTLTNVTVASFTAVSATLRNLIIDVTPVQSGSGDPSPDNVRPISGWTGANVTRTGINVWDEEWEVGSIDNNTGANKSGATTWRCKNYIPVKPNTAYYFNNGSLSSSIRYYWYDKNNAFISGSSTSSAVLTSPSNAYFLRIRDTEADGATPPGNISINYPSTDTSYHAYTGTTVIIDLDGTRYGGTLNVTTGVLTVTDANIASYDGETLPGEWISDRDVYAEGTTPTTGAQVVYKLSTPQTYQLTPTEVTTLLGQNNVWADTGNINTITFRTH